MNESEAIVFGISQEEIDAMCEKAFSGDVGLLAMSILSDAQDSLEITKDWERSRKLINIAKYIISTKLFTKK